MLNLPFCLSLKFDLQLQMSVTFIFTTIIFLVYNTYIVSCVLPAPPLNGTLLNNSQNTDLIEGSVITFQCDPGFALVGAGTVTCNNSGLWDPALLECTFNTGNTGAHSIIATL